MYSYMSWKLLRLSCHSRPHDTSLFCLLSVHEESQAVSRFKTINPSRQCWSTWVSLHVIRTSFCLLTVVIFAPFQGLWSSKDSMQSFARFVENCMVLLRAQICLSMRTMGCMILKGDRCSPSLLIAIICILPSFSSHSRMSTVNHSTPLNDSGYQAVSVSKISDIPPFTAPDLFFDDNSRQSMENVAI